MKKKHFILLGFLGMILGLMPVTALAATSTTTQATAHTPHLMLQKGKYHNQSATTNVATASLNMTYHGGQEMTGTMNVYLIFWEPNSSVSANYHSLITRYANDIGNSSLYQIGQQYKDSFGNSPTNSHLAGTWVDNSAYPSHTTAATIYDSDIQNEVTRAQAANTGWTSGINNAFFVFTQRSENICIDTAGTQCASNTFCAYHGYFGATTDPTIYAAMPYAASFKCNPEFSGVTPNADDADQTINVLSHEQMEAATDPLLNAWYDDSTNQEEIGDKCAWTFGPVDSRGADVNFNSHPYLLQQEWSNAITGCALTTSTARQYYRIVNRHSGLVMDVSGGGTNPGAQVIQWSNHFGINQQWYLQPDGSTFQIVNRHSGLVMDVAGSATNAVANVIQNTNSHNASQQWYLDPEGAYDVLQNINSNMVADVSGGSTSAGAHVIQNFYTNGTNQQWTLVPIKTYYVVKNINSGLVMDVSGGSTSAGAHVIQWPSNGGTNQEWSIVSDGSNFQMVNRKSGLVADVFGGGTNAGANVIQWTNHNGRNQQWKLLPSATTCLAGNTCQIQNINSGLVMDVFGGGKTQGVNVIQWTNHNGLNQQWKFIPVFG